MPEAGDSSLLANRPLIWEAAALLPADTSRGLCYTLVKVFQGVTSTSVLGVKSCSPYLSFQAKWPRTRSPAALWCCQGRFPSPSQEGLTGITVCQLSLRDPRDVGDTPPSDKEVPRASQREQGALTGCTHSQLDLQPSLPSPPLSLWARVFCGTAWIPCSWGFSPHGDLCQAGLAH